LELLVNARDRSQLAVGIIRVGALLLPLVLIGWGGLYGRASSALAWLGLVVLVGHLSTPFDSVSVTFEGGPTNSLSVYAALPAAALVILAGVPFGRLFGRSRFFGGSVRAAAA
jgi:hypothetical protein